MRKRSRTWSFERLVLYAYFVVLILVGSVLLGLPVAWGGSGSVSYIDSLFTAVSAVCVTGLVTVDTSLWSRWGQVVILVLIQMGGLGIVTFGTLYLLVPRSRISLRSSRMLRSVFVSENRTRVRQNILAILGTTLVVEFLGAVGLFVAFRRVGTGAPVFEAVFHAVSAFCNAGFSLFSDGFVSFRSNVLVNSVLMGLVVVGGIGFVVVRDVRTRVFAGKRALNFHTRIVLAGTAVFVAGGFLVYVLFEYRGALRGLPVGERVLAALFQSVTTRTAGFNTLDQGALSSASQWVTLVLMLTGGAPGSTAGGIKVTTAFILLVVVFRGVGEHGDIELWNRRIPGRLVSRSAMFFLKAMALFFLCTLVLGVVEHAGGNDFTANQIIFESVSALGTVGLSLGITGSLSTWGKCIVALTMFAGRVGLFSLVIRTYSDRTEKRIKHPEGEVLIG